MSTRNTAEEHLRVIRSLMEKATIYRAISAPTALVGGCAGILASAVFYFQSPNVEYGAQAQSHLAQAQSHLFLGCWLCALGIAAVGNIYFLRADARRRGEKFVSAGMRAALRALWPSYLVAAVVTIMYWRYPAGLPIYWMLFYSLGLLATQHFAPRSIVLLGWAFLAAGLINLIGFEWLSTSPTVVWRNLLLPFANLAMGVTFGGFHLIYAACAWPRVSRVAGEHGEAADAGNAP